MVMALSLPFLLLQPQWFAQNELLALIQPAPEQVQLPS
jgi:hypothetical protein